MKNAEQAPQAGPVQEFGPDDEQLRRAAELRELFTYSDEMVERNRERIWSAAEQVAGLVFDSEQRQAIAEQAELVEWVLFAKPGTALPSRVALIQNSTCKELVVDHRVPYYNPSWLSSALNGAGLQTVMNEVGAEVNSRETEAKSLLRDMILDTNEYRFLAAFDNSLQTPEATPLNDYWRLVRTAQVRGSLAVKYGMDTEDTSRTHPHAERFHKDLQRRTRQIDDETTPEDQLPEDQQDAFARLQAYLHPRVITEYIASANHYSPALSQDPNDLEVIYSASSGELGIALKDRDDPTITEDTDYGEAWDDAKKVGETLSSELYIGAEETRFIAETFMGNAVYDMIDPRLSGSYTLALDVAVKNTVDYLWDLLRDAHNPYSFGTHTSQTEAAAFLKLPSETPLDAEWFSKQLRGQPTGWYEVFGSGIFHATLREIQRTKSQVIGEIGDYEPTNFRVPLRLMMLGAAQGELRKEAQESDALSLALWEIDARVAPYIPGYKLVRHVPFANVYGFEIDRAGDPYARCEVGVMADSLDKLQKSWRRIGLEQLANDVAAYKQLTVAEMVSLIRGHADYLLPDKLDYNFGEDPLTSYSTHSHNLEDFQKLVKNGRLQVQCTGAAQFLRYSLELAFGSGCANTIGGHFLSGQDRNIVATQHAQTIFVHDSKQYILDATPAADIPGWEREPLGNSSAFTQQVTPHIPELAKPTSRPNQDVEYARATSATLSETVDALTKNHKEYLKVSFGVPTDAALYDHIVALPPDDPVRRSLQLLVRFANGTITKDQVSAEVEYLKNCASASNDMRKQLKFHHYPIQFLEHLSWNAGNLQYAIDRHDN